MKLLLCLFDLIMLNIDKTKFILLILLVLFSCSESSSGVTSTSNTSSTSLSIHYGINRGLYIALANTNVLLEQRTDFGSQARFYINPRLPSGLSLDSASGNISGMPTTLSFLAQYIITATADGNEYISETISLGVSPSQLWVTNTNSANPYQLTAYVVGDGSKQTGVSWSSGDLSLATVNNNGVVDIKTSRVGGDVLITATKDGNTGGMVFKVDSTPISIDYGVSKDFYMVLTNTSVLLEQKMDFGSQARFSTSSSFPIGLFLDSNNGDIRGKSTTSKLPAPYTVTATVDGKTYNKTISLGVSPSRVWVVNTNSANPYELTAYVVGDGSKQIGVSWSSSDTSLATVNNNGVVDIKTALIGGDVVITATKDGNTGGMVFKVDSTPVSIDYGVNEDIYVALTSANVLLKQTGDFGGQVRFSVSPNLPSGLSLNATNGNIKGRPTIASLLTAYTVTASIGSENYTNKVISLGVAPSQVWVVSTNADKPSELTAYVVGDGSKQTGISWSSSDTSLATVNSNGVVTFKVAPLGGNVEIIATTVDGNTGRVTLNIASDSIDYGTSDFYIARVNTVIDLVQKSRFNSTTFSVSPALPNGLTIDTARGSISGTPTVVTLTREYTVTARAGGRSQTKKIILGVAPDQLWVTNVDPAKLYELTAYVVGDRTQQTGVSWSSSDTSIATVNNGRVTIKTLPLGGDVEIIATKDGNTSKVTFNVSKMPIDYGTRDFYITRVNNQINLVQNTRFDGSTVFSVTPTLPNGLTLDTTSGSISGTALAVVLPREYTITATAGSRSDSKKIILGIISSQLWVTNAKLGSSYELTAYVVGDRTQQTGVSWSSSDTSLATVSNGVVVFVSTSTGGSVRITASKDGNSRSVFFTVDKVEDVSDGKIIIKGGVTNLVINSGVTTIARYQFQRKGLSQVTIPDSVTTIGNEAFYDNELTSVVISKNLTGLGNSAFALNQLTSVEIPNRVSFIGNSAFYNNRLINVVISDGVVTIGEEAFASNPLTNVVIPDSVTDIKRQAFYGNELTSVVIPDSVTSLGSEAFVYNRNLVEVSLKQSLYDSLGSSGREDVFGSQVKKYIRHP